MKKSKRGLVVQNDSENIVFITYKWASDPCGGPASIESHSCVLPGQSIDLAMIGFSLVAPPKRSRNKAKRP